MSCSLILFTRLLGLFCVHCVVLVGLDHIVFAHNKGLILHWNHLAIHRPVLRLEGPLLPAFCPQPPRLVYFVHLLCDCVTQSRFLLLLLLLSAFVHKQLKITFFPERRFSAIHGHPLTIGVFGGKIITNFLAWIANVVVH